MSEKTNLQTNLLGRRARVSDKFRPLPPSSPLLAYQDQWAEIVVVRQGVSPSGSKGLLITVKWPDGVLWEFDKNWIQLETESDANKPSKSSDSAFLVTTESDGLETILEGMGVLIVPVETLDDDRKEQLEDGDYGKLLKHGGEFPAIYLSEILEALEDCGKLDEMLEACRNTRKRLDETK
jgi:hypothetical protein